MDIFIDVLLLAMAWLPVLCRLTEIWQEKLEK